MLGKSLIVVLLGLALQAAALAAAQGQQSSAAGQQQQQKPTTTPPAGAEAAAPAKKEEPPKAKEFVGAEICGTCHEDIAKGFVKDRHHAIEFNKKFEGKSCEACHGPGSIHAESVDPKDIIRKNGAACASCHVNQAARSNRAQAGHTRNNVDCFACHNTMHKPVPVGLAKTRATTANCSSCHTNVQAQFAKPHRHPVTQPTAVMGCVDCHDPHGGPLPKMTRSVHAAETNCVKCHGDKRGPFVFEHAPVRLEGCASCHEPHGSANPKMLTRQEERFVCLECHSNIGAPRAGASANVSGGVPPAIHDLRSPRFRSCSTCHVKVHGSHANRSFLR
jgi:DmsE family decaheme c-type cytochrome